MRRPCTTAAPRSGGSLIRQTLVLFALLAVVALPAIARADDTDNPWLELGVEESFSTLERKLTKDQVRTFIPPLLRGFTPLHGFVLPPNACVVSLATRTATLTGEDFFRAGDRNLVVFGDSRVERLFVDLGVFWGFDLGRKHLHSFTAFLNVPYQGSRTDGAIHPNGVSLIDVMNRGATQEVGDISLIIKKKMADQANFPVGLALSVGAYFPTGKNDERFGEDGLVLSRMPAIPPSMLQMMGASSMEDLVGMPLSLGMVMGLDQMLAPFPFNEGVFDRFSDDGRLPSPLQPGDGAFSFVAGAAITRQFLPGDLPLLDRAAFHLATLHRFRGKADGIHRGDINTHQASFVVPVWADFLAVEAGYLGFYQYEDSYDGTFILPFFTDASGNAVDAMSATHMTFKEIERPPFTGGEWGNIASSLIISPDPQIRLVATLLTRVVAPDLGPAPSNVFRFSTQVMF